MKLPLPSISQVFLSTPSARRATGSLQGQQLEHSISIHALREEGDLLYKVLSRLAIYFYPRPPRGGRPLDGCPDIGPLEFLSTPSARRATNGKAVRTVSREFLSTPSARRATSA